MNQEELALLSLSPRSAEEATATLRVVVGAVHRLVWDGPDPDGDRVRLDKAMNAAAEQLQATSPAMAGVVDWWRTAAGLSNLGVGWGIDRLLAAGVGDVLREILDHGGDRPLDVVRAPAALEAAVGDLRRLTQVSMHKIAAANAVLTAAVAECRKVEHAYQAGLPFPAKLRLVGASDEELASWAGEPDYSGRTVNPNTPVWGWLLKALRERSDAVVVAAGLWNAREHRVKPLPENWRDVVRAACGLHGDVAVALVADATAESGDRPELSSRAVWEAFADPIDQVKPVHLVVAREASAAAERDLPASVVAVRDELAGLRERLKERRSYEGDAKENLDLAREALERLDVSEARAFLLEAEQAHQQTLRAVGVERVLARARPKAQALRGAGLVPPPEGGDEHGWAEAVDNAFLSALQALRSDVTETHQRADPADPVATASHVACLEALERDDLVTATQHLEGLRSVVVRAEQAVAERLGPELVSVRTSASALPVTLREAVGAALERAAARRHAGLGDAGLTDELRRLVSAMLASEPVAAVGVPRGDEVARVAFGLAGVAATGLAAGPGVAVGPLRVVGAGRDALARRVAGWGLLTDLMPDGWPGRVYKEYADGMADGALRVEGPYVLRDDGLVAERRDGAVGLIDRDAFVALFGGLPVPGIGLLVPMAPSFDELLKVSPEVLDSVDDETLGHWLSKHLGGAPSSEAIHAWLQELDDPDTLPALRDDRLERFGQVLEHVSALEKVRDDAVAAFLEGPAGRDAIARAAAARVDERAEEHQARVSARLEEINAAMQAAEADLSTVRDRVREEEGRVGAALDAKRLELEDLSALAVDRRAHLLVELFGVTRGSGPMPAGEVEAPLRSTPWQAGEALPLRDVVERVAGDTWDQLDVANLLLSLGTGRWTLLAGLPGVGKSTFARSVLTRLGHGPATERWLELVVRRDWADDAALFGFWHPTEARWAPSSDGLLEHVLRSNDPVASGALWPVLVEELNLASPEYYLARALSAFEAPDPVLRLYGPALRPVNAARYPSEVRVGPGVRMVGTVNVDDTVERLSPRFLSRTSVLWMEPRPDQSAWTPSSDVSELSVPLAALGGERVAELGPLQEVIRFLVDRRVPGAPTQRTVGAIGRYLGAAPRVMAADVAQDLQICQRILPPLRGVGPRWRTLLDDLVKLLQRHGWRRAARRTQDLRERGEELGDWYDFFHT